jgi:hypothetical protein
VDVVHTLSEDVFDDRGFDRIAIRTTSGDHFDAFGLDTAVGAVLHQREERRTGSDLDLKDPKPSAFSNSIQPGPAWAAYRAGGRTTAHAMEQRHLANTLMTCKPVLRSTAIQVCLVQHNSGVPPSFPLDGCWSIVILDGIV